MSDERNGYPTHWYDHHAAGGVVICLAGDMLRCEDGHPLDNPTDSELIQLCGSCGHMTQAFHSEYTGTSDTFKEMMCPNCFSSNFRGTSVVVSREYAKEITQEDIHRYILNRHDMRAWRAEVMDVDTEVPQAMSQQLPDASVQSKRPIQLIGLDWEVRCPACGTTTEQSDFDFHHWDYDEDIGCQICRECHNHIHRGMRAFDQTKEVGTEWQRDAVPRLYERATSNGLEFHDPGAFRRRFNIPKGSTAAKAVSETFNEMGESVSLGELMRDE
jgi:hypothetical protein